MTLDKKSIVLSVAFLALLAVVIFDRPKPIQEAAKLPALQAVLLKNIERVELVRAGEKTVLEKTNENWRVASPFKDKGDGARIKKMLVQFRKSIVMDVMVENGNHEQYGLDASNGIVVEVFESGTTPSITFTIGYDAGNGASFVRLSGDTKVYRARVGGRVRFDYSSSQWRNQKLLNVENAQVNYLSIDGQEIKYSLSKSPDKIWSISPPEQWIPSQKTIQSTVLRLSNLRIGSRVEHNLAPQFNISIQTPDTSLEIAVELSDSAYVQILGDPQIYKVSKSVFSDLVKGTSFYRDLNIYDFQARQVLAAIQYKDANQKLTFQQDHSNGFWKPYDPPGIDIDMQRVFYFVNSLAALNALSIVSEDGAGVPERDPDIVLSMQTVNNKMHRFSMWRISNSRVYGVKSDDPRVFEIDHRFYQKTQVAFGLAE